MFDIRCHPAQNNARELQFARIGIPISSPEEFRQVWSRFLQRNDVLVVYHQRTFQLLRNIEAVQPRCITLTSVFRIWRTEFRSGRVDGTRRTNDSRIAARESRDGAAL